MAETECLTIASRYEEARPGRMVWRGLVSKDGQQIHCSTHDCELDAMRAATEAREAYERGGYDEMIRQAMLLDARMQRALYGPSCGDEWTPDMTTKLLPQARDGDGGREGELAWS